MGGLRKLSKNAQKYNDNQMVCITVAEYNRRMEDVRNQYRKAYEAQLEDIKKEFAETSCELSGIVLDLIRLQIIDVLAKKLDAYNTDDEYFDQKKELIQSIMMEATEASEKITTYKRPRREVNKLKNKIKKIFDIEFSND